MVTNHLLVVCAIRHRRNFRPLLNSEVRKAQNAAGSIDAISGLFHQQITIQEIKMSSHGEPHQIYAATSSQKNGTAVCEMSGQRNRIEIASWALHQVCNQRGDPIVITQELRLANRWKGIVRTRRRGG
jgi:hypothetical protein